MNDIGRRTMQKTIWRLVPFLGVLYAFNIIDRANVGFARLQMKDSLGLTEAIVDWGYGIFYVGYILFEVPSNMFLRRFGARRWIARIMISWGLVSTLTARVIGPTSYFTARILLGVAAAAGIALVNSVANGGGIFAPKIIGSFGVGPMAGVMAWGMLMAILAWWGIERRAAAAAKS